MLAARAEVPGEAAKLQRFYYGRRSGF